jgi:hypothetical protein
MKCTIRLYGEWYVYTVCLTKNYKVTNFLPDEDEPREEGEHRLEPNTYNNRIRRDCQLFNSILVHGTLVLLTKGPLFVKIGVTLDGALAPPKSKVVRGYPPFASHGLPLGRS